MRLVKTIGDAAMLASTEPEPLLEVALELIDAADAEGEDFPQLRAGAALGMAVPRAGDWFGRPVNLASRITVVARPAACSPSARCTTRRPTRTAGRSPASGACAASANRCAYSARVGSPGAEADRPGQGGAESALPRRAAARLRRRRRAPGDGGSSARRAARCPRRRAPHAQVLGGDVGAEHEREREELPANVSQLLNSESHVPIQPGM